MSLPPPFSPLSLLPTWPHTWKMDDWRMGIYLTGGKEGNYCQAQQVTALRSMGWGMVPGNCGPSRGRNPVHPCTHQMLGVVCATSPCAKAQVPAPSPWVASPKGGAFLWCSLELILLCLAQGAAGWCKEPSGSKDSHFRGLHPPLAAHPLSQGYQLPSKQFAAATCESRTLTSTFAGRQPWG